MPLTPKLIVEQIAVLAQEKGKAYNPQIAQSLQALRDLLPWIVARNSMGITTPPEVVFNLEPLVRELITNTQREDDSLPFMAKLLLDELDAITHTERGSIQQAIKTDFKDPRFITQAMRWRAICSSFSTLG